MSTKSLSHEALAAAIDASFGTGSSLPVSSLKVPYFYHLRATLAARDVIKVTAKAGGTFTLLGAVRVHDTTNRTESMKLVYLAGGDPQKVAHPDAVHFCDVSTLSDGSLPLAAAAFGIC